MINGVQNNDKSEGSSDPKVVYAAKHSLRLSPVQEELLRETLENNPNPLLLSAPEVVQLLGNLLQSMNAKKFIDVGTFTGYSALGAALALPEDGKVITCDVTSTNLEFAQKFWKKAGVERKIEVKIQPALKTLGELIEEGGAGTFDMAFIDADKGNYDNYYESCLILMRKGGIIAFDNVLWQGKVLDPTDQAMPTLAIRAINEKLAKDERVNISFLTIGDGLTLAFKK